MNKIYKLLTELDIFGLNLSLKIFKRQHYKSIFGSLLSLFLFAYLFYKISSFITNIINKQTFTQVNNLYIEDNNVPINSYEFLICTTEGFGNYNFLKFSDYYTVIESNNIIEISDCLEANLTSLQNPSGSPVVETYKKFCLCGKTKENFYLKADLLKTELVFLDIKIFAKQKVFEFDFEASSIYFVNRNTYFDYSKKDSAINSYLFPVYISPKLISTSVNLYLNKIKYSEIIDFDLFYKKTSDYEDYTVSDFIERANGKAFKPTEISEKPIVSLSIFAGNQIQKYDITLFSFDTILATFSGVFQFLSMILGFIGHIYNNIFFDIQIKKSFFDYKEDIEVFECLKEIYKRKDFRAAYIKNSENLKISEERNLQEEKIMEFKNNINNKLVLNDNVFLKEDELDFKIKQESKSSNIKDNTLNLHEQENSIINSPSKNKQNSENNYKIYENLHNQQIPLIQDNPTDDKNQNKFLNNINSLKRNNFIVGSKNDNYDVIEINDDNVEKNHKVNINNANLKNADYNQALSMQKQSKKAAKKIFDDYICSYEFLFDMFSQLEFLKMLMLDEDLLCNFTEISKLYITMDSKDSNGKVDEIRRKLISERKINKQPPTPFDNNVREKIEIFLGLED